MKTLINLPPEVLNDPKMKRYLPILHELVKIPRKGKGRVLFFEEVAARHGIGKTWCRELLRRLKKGECPIRTRKEKKRIEQLGIAVRRIDVRAADKAISLYLANKNDHRDRKTLFTEWQGFCGAERLRDGSYRSFCRLLEKVPAPLIAMRDGGPRALKEDFIPSIRRDASAYRPMEALIADQHTHDWACFDDDFNVLTLEAFYCMDFRTQLLFPAIAAEHYQQFHVGQALTNALRSGIPSIFYSDLGKPEGSSYVSFLLEQLNALSIDSQPIQHIKAQGRWPRAKPIEGVFGIFDRRVRNKGLPGYRKRLHDPRANEAAQKELKRQIKQKQLLHQDEMVRELLNATDEWNRHAFVNRGRDTGSSPLQIYERETEKYPVLVLPDDVIDYLFLPEQTATVRHSQVRIKHPYIGPLNYYSPDLVNVNGDAVLVKWHPYEADSVWVFAYTKTGKPGEFIARAEVWQSINPKDQRAVAEKIEKQGHLVKLVRELYRAYVPKGGKHIRAVGPWSRAARELKEIAAEEKEVEQPLRLVSGLGGLVQDTQKPAAADTPLLKAFRKSLRAPNNDEEKREHGPARLFFFPTESETIG